MSKYEINIYQNGVVRITLTFYLLAPAKNSLQKDNIFYNLNISTLSNKN